MLLARSLPFMSLVCIGVNADGYGDDPPACDNEAIYITNQKRIDFYKSCPVIGGNFFGINDTFKGPFDLPGVESVPAFTVGTLAPNDDEPVSERSGVTSISMPDLKNVTKFKGVFVGYLENLTSISFPKLEFVDNALFFTGSPGLRNISLPSLTNVSGPLALYGTIDHIDLPALKAVGYMRVETNGNVSCAELAKRFTSLKFTPVDMAEFSGFSCLGSGDNVWPKPKSDDASSSSAAIMLQFGYGHLVLAVLMVLLNF